MIAWTIYITFAGALGLLFMPQFFARWIALATALAGFTTSLLAFLDAHNVGTFATIVRIPWIPTLGMEFHLAADGISLTLALVTGLTAVSAVLFSWMSRSGLTNFSSGSCSLSAGHMASSSAPIYSCSSSSTSWSSCRNISSSRSGVRRTRNMAR